MAAPITPPISRVARKWADRAASAQPFYAEGVQTTTADWAALSEAAAGNYQAGVQAAIGRQGFQKGVRKAGTQKWRRKSADVGAPRFAQGVTVAEPDFSAGFQPFLELIGRTDLPPRGPAGDERNFQRVAAIGRALHQMKIGGGR